MNLLAGGYRSSIATLVFDPARRSLAATGAWPTPPNPSWLARAGGALLAVNEEDSGGRLVVLDGESGAVQAQVETGGAPCHLLVLEDEGKVVVSNYVSGTVSTHALSPPYARLSSVALPYAYASGAPPVPARQDAPHAHHALRAPNGQVLVCDLGSDRVYVLDEARTGVAGWVQCPAGFGPRHAVVSADGSAVYVLGELAHAVEAYPLPIPSGAPADAIPGSHASILPPSVPAAYTAFMDSAELLHPCKGTLYASNRLEARASAMNPDLEPLADPHTGDAVAIVLLDAQHRVESVTHVRTGCATVRAMVLSPDATHVAVAGQDNARVEVYAVSGARREVWSLVAALDGVDKVTDIVWH